MLGEYIVGLDIFRLSPHSTCAIVGNACHVCHGASTAYHRRRLLEHSKCPAQGVGRGVICFPEYSGRCKLSSHAVDVKVFIRETTIRNVKDG